MDSLYDLAPAGLAKWAWLSLPAAVLLVLFVAYRSGSLHPILARLWLLAAGKQKLHEHIHDPALKAFMRAQHDLGALRFMYPLKAYTLKKFKAILAWVKAHDLELRDVVRARDWVDPDWPGYLREPREAGVWFCKGFLSISWPFMLLGCLLVLMTELPVHDKQTRAWYWIGKQTVHTFWGNKVLLDASHCDDKPFKFDARISPDVASAVCHSVAGKSIEADIAKALNGWRGVGLGLLAFFGSLVLVFVTELRAMAAARRLLESIRKQKAMPQPAPPKGKTPSKPRGNRARTETAKAEKVPAGTAKLTTRGKRAAASAEREQETV